MALHLQSYKKIFTLCGRAGQNGQGTYGGRGGEGRNKLISKTHSSIAESKLFVKPPPEACLKLCCRTNFMVMFNNFVSTASFYRDVSEDADLYKSIKITGTSKAHLRFFI